MKRQLPVKSILIVFLITQMLTTAGAKAEEGVAGIALSFENYYKEQEKKDDEIEVCSMDAVTSISEDEFELFAKCVMAEAGGESFKGQYMVAAVVLNRVDDEDYPDTISEVIKQKNEFTTWGNGMIDEAVPTKSIYKAVLLALEVNDLPDDVIFFSSSGYQTAFGIPWKKVGNHYFSKKK